MAGICATLGGFAQSTPPADSSLRQVLSVEEFTRAGLGKLTPSELAALEAVLANHGLLPSRSSAVADMASSPAAPTADARRTESAQPKPTAPAKRSRSDRDFGSEQVVKPITADTANELRSRIEGTLDELTGRSVFVLENGQVWQQRIPDTAHFPNRLINPEVVITRGFGGYKMVILPVDRVVFVKRIQ